MKLIATFILSIVFAVTFLGAQETVTKRPDYMSKFAWAVGICETGKGHRYPDFKHRTSSYEGFVGWYHGTWDIDKPKGYPDHAYQATPRQQYKVFLIGRERGRYWGCIANGGYKYWLR